MPDQVIEPASDADPGGEADGGGAGEAGGAGGVATEGAAPERATEIGREVDAAAKLVWASLRGADLRTWLGWLGDAGAVLMLTWLLWWLSDDDGGFTSLDGPQRKFGPVVIGLALLAPWLIGEVRRLPRSARLILALWGVGTIVSLVFAQDRTQWVPATMALAALPLTFLTAARVWRHRWGPAAIAAILMLAFGAYWYRSFLTWWGLELLASAPKWAALTWHNQAGTLMGALAVVFTGLAFVRSVPIALTAALLAAGGYTGAYLSSSRAALGLTLVGGVVAVAAAMRLARREPGRTSRTFGVLAAVIALSAVVSLALLGMYPSGGPTPLETRTESVVGNTGQRFLHMGAAVGMFASDPLTGLGPGSYRQMAIHTNSTAGGLTASAHNELLEPFAEGGLALGLPVLAAVTLAALLALMTLLRPAPAPTVPADTSSDDDVDVVADVARWLRFGAAGAVLVLLAHALIDFDWSYPVLPGLLATLTAGLWVRAEHPGSAEAADVAPAAPRSRNAVAWAALVPVLAVAVLGSWGNQRLIEATRDFSGDDAVAFATFTAPWETERRVTVARQLIARGDLDAAELAIDGMARWNPGQQTWPVLRAMVAFRRGDLSADQLRASLLPEPTWLGPTIWVAEELAIAGDTETALEVVAQAQHYATDYTAWGGDEVAFEASLLGIEIIGRARGCDAATVEAARVSRFDYIDGIERRLTSVTALTERLCNDL